MRWCEGPVWVGDGRYLLWSDIPNNRIMKWEEETGAVSVFRKPSNNANGNTRDRQGRLLTCEHDSRRVTRTEHDGSITVIADRFDGKPLNSPNDIVCKSDGSIWFTDPPFGVLGYYEGHVAKPELPTNVYRWDPRTSKLAVATGDVNRPNGLAFSPDESKLYIIEAAPNPRVVRVYDVVEGGTRLSNAASSSRPNRTERPTLSRGRRRQSLDGLGHGTEALDGVNVFNSEAKLIGRIDLPNAAPTSASAASTAIASSCCKHSVYSLYVNTQGAAGG